MASSTAFPRRLAIVTRQIDRLRALLNDIIGTNPFYTKKLEEAGVPYKIRDLSEFSEAVPFTTKQELVEDQRANPPYGTNLTFPLDRYVRCHQTSGTAGMPLRWLDTPESWESLIANWTQIFQTAGVAGDDRVFFAFSFGPFIGFWMAFESATRLGCLCLPGGGLSTSARVRTILDLGITVLCCTPSYAIRLAEVANEENLDLARSQVRLIVVAGEPGGSIPAVRDHLARLWPQARVYDHHGMTEVGAVTYECPARPGVLHVLEDSYIAEVIDPATGQAVEPGQPGELVLTTLMRSGSPVLRYRTGDLVQASPEFACECGRQELALEGGILGRADDMVIVRGVNVFPSSVEQIIRRHEDVAEYQIQIDSRQPLVEMKVQVEPTPACQDGAELACRLEQAFQTAFALRVPVNAVPVGSLPRFEAKAKRWQRV